MKDAEGLNRCIEGAAYEMAYTAKSSLKVLGRAPYESATKNYWIIDLRINESYRTTVKTDCFVLEPAGI